MIKNNKNDKAPTKSCYNYIRILLHLRLMQLSLLSFSFLRLRVTVLAFLWSFYFFFSFSYSSLFLDGLVKLFLSNFRQLFLQTCVTKIKSPSLYLPTNYCLRLKFCVWEHGMSCALEKNSNSGFKRVHNESCSSNTKNIISPLPQCPWPPNLLGCNLL